MKAGQIFETTFVDGGRDLAMRVISMPRAQISDPSVMSSEEELLGALRLRARYEVPRPSIADAISAVLANTHIEDAARWLQEPPRAVPLIPVELPRRRPREYGGEALYDLWSEGTAAKVPSLDRPPAKRPRRRPKQRSIPKQSMAAREIESFAEEASAELLVPFQRSPLDVYSFSDLFQLAGEARAWLVTAGTNPLVLLKVSGGYLLVQAVLGIGSGIRRGLSEGVEYRLLQLFGAPPSQTPAPTEQTGQEPQDEPGPAAPGT